MIESMVKYISQALVLKDSGIYKDGVKNTFYLFSEKKFIYYPVEKSSIILALRNRKDFNHYPLDHNYVDTCFKNLCFSHDIERFVNSKCIREFFTDIQSFLFVLNWVKNSQIFEKNKNISMTKAWSRKLIILKEKDIQQLSRTLW